MRIEFDGADAKYFNGKTEEVVEIKPNGKGNLPGKGPVRPSPINYDKYTIVGLDSFDPVGNPVDSSILDPIIIICDPH
jgi:hypothetical protein